MYITAPDTQSVSPAENKSATPKSPGGHGDNKPGFLGQLKLVNEQAAEKQHHDLKCDDKAETDTEHNMAATLSRIEEINSNDFMLLKTGIQVNKKIKKSN